MKFASRIKRLEKAVEEIRMQKGGYRCVIVYPGETKAQALTRADIKEDTADLVVVILKFAEPGKVYELPKPKTPKPVRKPAEIDLEIEKIKGELARDGFTPQEIAELAEEDDFSVLGLYGDIIFLFDKESGLPLQIRGEAPRIGPTEINLKAVTTRPGGTLANGA